MKTSQCQVRRQALGTKQNPKTSNIIELGEELLTMCNKSNFLLFDYSYGGKRALGFSSAEHFKVKRCFFLNGTFKSCRVS